MVVIRAKIVEITVLDASMAMILEPKYLRY
jgi:hypothetical protein